MNEGLIFVALKFNITNYDFLIPCVFLPCVRACGDKIAFRWMEKSSCIMCDTKVVTFNLYAWYLLFYRGMQGKIQRSLMSYLKKGIQLMTRFISGCFANSIEANTFCRFWYQMQSPSSFVCARDTPSFDYAIVEVLMIMAVPSILHTYTLKPFWVRI